MANYQVSARRRFEIVGPDDSTGLARFPSSVPALLTHRLQLLLLLLFDQGHHQIFFLLQVFVVLIRGAGVAGRCWWRLALQIVVDVVVIFDGDFRQFVTGDEACRPRDGGRRGRIFWALVVHEVMPPAESSGAELALERLLALVDEHVGLELVRVGEPRRAQFAGVGPLARVDAQVAPQVGDLHELAVAVRTVVRLLARMQTHVRLEVVVAGESLAALLALERLLARVRPLVVLQDVLVAESPVADGAAKHLVPRSYVSVRRLADNSDDARAARSRLAAAAPAARPVDGRRRPAGRRADRAHHRRFRDDQIARLDDVGVRLQQVQLADAAVFGIATGHGRLDRLGFRILDGHSAGCVVRHDQTARVARQVIAAVVPVVGAVLPHRIGRRIRRQLLLLLLMKEVVMLLLLLLLLDDGAESVDAQSGGRRCALRQLGPIEQSALVLMRHGREIEGQRGQESAQGGVRSLPVMVVMMMERNSGDGL